MATEKSNHFKISEFLSSRFFYLMSVGVLLAWVMVSGIVDTTVFARNHTANLVRIFFIVGFFGLILSHKMIRRIGFVLFLIAALVVASDFLLPFEALSFVSPFTDLMSETIDFILGNRPYQLIYETFTVWTISLFFSFFVTFFVYHKFQFWFLFLVSIVTTGIAITSPHFRHRPIFYIYVFCLLALTIRYLQEKKLEKISTSFKPIIVTHLIIPLAAVVLLFAHLLPTPAMGFSENFIRAPFDALNDWFWELTHQSEFSLRQIGFGNSNGRLGGDIQLNDDVFMEIRLHPSMPNIHSATGLYLTGATRDTYTGSSWENLHDQFALVNFNDHEQQLEWLEHRLAWEFHWLQTQVQMIQSGTFEPIDPFLLFDDEFDWEVSEELRIFIDESTGHTIFAMTELGHWYEDVSQSNLVERHYLTINNLNRRISSMFHSGIVREIQIDDDEYTILRNRDGAFLSEERLQGNTTYHIAFYRPHFYIQIRTEDGELVDRNLYEISQAFQIFRDTYGYELQQPMLNFNGQVMTIEALLNDYLIPRAERINEVYTVLPDDLPERIRELALEVTSEGENNYEKMRLLESFLSGSFPYTLSPGVTPIDRDFVDHFLFDLQQGYCVHFATAFVVMARSLGMPTRYAEGFLVNPNGTTEVLNSMAHAWPEVYFEGFGWVIFEPTPASGIGFGQEDETNGLDGHQDSQDREEMIVPPQDPRPIEPTGEDSFIGGGGDDALVLVTETQEISWWLLGTSGVFIAIAVLIFIRVTHLHLKRELLMKKERRQRIITHFQLLLAYLKIFDHEITEIETVSQFATRIGNRRDLGALNSERNLLKKSISTFIKARYSNQDISEEDCFPIEEMVRNLEHRVELKLGKPKYLWYRYILGKF